MSDILNPKEQAKQIYDEIVARTEEAVDTPDRIYASVKLIHRAIEKGIMLGVVSRGLFPRSEPFTVVIQGMGKKGLFAQDEEPWLGAGKSDDCGVLLDLGEQRVFVPTAVEVVRTLPLEKPLRARVVFEPGIEAEPLPPKPEPKENLRRLVLRSNLCGPDEEDRPVATMNANVIIGCNRCRTTSHFLVNGFSFGSSIEEFSLRCLFPRGWTRSGTDDLCPRCSEEKPTGDAP